MPIDYKQTWIYKLACKDLAITDFYLGYSTATHDRLYDMFRQRSKRDSWHLCTFIREHGGIENFYIQKLVSLECTCSMEARTELRKHFDATPPSLNKRMPTRTHQEYAKEDAPRARQKIYRGINRERILLDQRERYIANKEKLSIDRKLYYIKHGERIRAQVNARRHAARAAVLQLKLEELDSSVCA
jgi:hypothetical protein